MLANVRKGCCPSNEERDHPNPALPYVVPPAAYRGGEASGGGAKWRRAQLKHQREQRGSRTAERL
jgi:hypothetical protein